MAFSSGLKRVSSYLLPAGDYDVRPVGFAWRSHSLFITSTAGVGFFTDLFLYALVVPILPMVLSDRANIPDDQIQSYTSALLTAYATASVIFSPIAGIVADRTSSRQTPFLCGLICLAISTVLLFTGRSISILILARIGQGASSAVVWTVGLALCIDTVGPKRLGKVVGTTMSLASVGALFAPIIGGAVYKHAGFFAVGILAMSLLVVDFVMRILVIEKTVALRYLAAGEPGIDTDEQDAADDAADEDSPLLRKQSDPSAFFIPPDIPAWYHKFPIAYPICKSPSLLAGFLTAGVQALLLGSFDATVSTHASDLFRFDSLKTGLLFVPLGALNFIVGPIAGWCVDRYGAKVVAVFGFTFMVPALVVLRIPTAEPLVQMSILYGGLLAICGIGLAAIDAPAIVECGAVVERYHRRNPGFFGDKGPYAQLYGLTSMVFSIGLSVGPELAGELKRAIGYGNMVIVLATISGANALVCFIWLGGKPKIFGRQKS